MNRSPTFAIWEKEIRAALPLWAASVLALILPTIVGQRVFSFSISEWHFLAFAVGSVAVAASIIAREFQDHTLIWQLVQPQSRMSLFNRKIVTAVAYQILLAPLFLVVEANNRIGAQNQFTTCLLVSLVALASAVFWGILLKNVVGATVLAIVAPYLGVFMIFAWIEWLANRMGDEWAIRLGDQTTQSRVFIALFSTYAAGAAMGAFLLWRRMQLKGEAETLSRLETKVFSRLAGAGAFVKRPAWVALFRKELGLLRLCFWLAAIFVGASVAFAIADQVLGRSDAPTWRENMRMLAVALFAIYLALVPVLAGAFAFAEEYQLGNRAWQLCQPATATRQLLIKLSTALSLSAVLGLLLPGLVALAYASTKLGSTFIPSFEREAIVQLFITHFLLFGTAAWCASWSRTSLTAIVKTFVFIVVFVLIQSHLIQRDFDTHSGDWRIGALALGALALLLTPANYLSLSVSRRHWLGQTLLLGCAAYITYFISKHFL